MISFLLLTVAIMLAATFFGVGILTTLIRSLIRWKRVSFFAYLAQSAQSLALSIDLMGNVVCRDLLELTLTHDYLNYPFGNYLETISKVLGINKHLNTLTKLGRGLAWLLNLIDPGHVERAAGLPIPSPDPLQVLIRAYVNRYWPFALVGIVLGQLLGLLLHYML